MPIVSKVYKSEQLTTFAVTGKITLEDIMQELEFFYKGEPTKNALWDFSSATLWNFTKKDVDIINSFSPRYEKDNNRSKTALVAKDGQAFELAILIKESGETDNLPFKVEVVSTVEAAYKWLS